MRLIISGRGVVLTTVFKDAVTGKVAKLVPLVGEMEVYLGALGFRDLAEAAGLEVCLPELRSAAEGERVLLGLFNPLLVAGGGKAVPCDVVTDRADTTLLVTGPNSGGKTRLLQSVALTQLLAQAGMFVPARRASVARVPGLVVSLIQAVTQIQEQTLSFVPKLIAVSVTFVVALPWIIQIMLRYTSELFRSLPSLAS